MNDLTPEREQLLEECLLAMDQGESIEEVLARHPRDADELRPYLEMRASLASVEKLEPPAPAVSAGRSQLLQAVAASQQPKPSIWSAFAGALLGRTGSALARAGAVAVVLLVVGAGALGVSAAGGFQPARDTLRPARNVLERFQIIRDNDDKQRPEPTERPLASPTETGGVAEPTRPPARPTATPVRDLRPTSTARPDGEPTATPVRDARPTAISDGPVRPIDRPTATSTPARDIAPSDGPVDVRPTAIRPIDVAPSDSRGGAPEPTPSGQDFVPTVAPVDTTRTPEPEETPARDAPDQDEPDIVVGDGVRELPDVRSIDLGDLFDDVDSGSRD